VAALPPAPLADPAGAKKPLPVLDSVSRARKAAAAAESAAAAAKPSGPSRALTERLDRLTAAVGTGDLSKVERLFPGMSQEQRNALEAVYSKSSRFKATPAYGTPVPRGDVKDDVVDMDYEIKLNYSDAAGQPYVQSLRYRATLHWVPRFAAWQIESLATQK
jgi:hypothetical protein